MDWFPWENLQEPHRFSHEIWVVNLVSSTHLGMATIPPLEMVIWRMVYDIVYPLRSHYSCEIMWIRFFLSVWLSQADKHGNSHIYVLGSLHLGVLIYKRISIPTAFDRWIRSWSSAPTIASPSCWSLWPFGTRTDPHAPRPHGDRSPFRFYGSNNAGLTNGFNGLTNG